MELFRVVDLIVRLGICSISHQFADYQMKNPLLLVSPDALNSRIKALEANINWPRQ
jgi:hypothetical protein